jgi:predicted amidophosphoribosyltransferase
LGADVQGARRGVPDKSADLQSSNACRCSDVQNPNRLYYKQNAINYSATALQKLIPGEWRERSTFVPIPPSKTKSDPGYDFRLLSILRAVRPRLKDVRELILQTECTVSKQKQVSLEERVAILEVNEECEDPTPQHIVIFDDVVAGGTHFRATKLVLERRFPNVKISGLFLARSVRSS